jgi:RNA polymerase sigma-70 factor, ECF subfamily
LQVRSVWFDVNDHPLQSVPGITQEPAADDSSLVETAKQDRQAFAALYRANVEPVYRFCYHRLNSREAAEDATSEVFMKALARLHTHQSDRSFRSWLFAIAHNVVIDTYRARKPANPLNAIPEIVDLAPSPEEWALTAAAVQEVRNVLSELPPGQREILELRLAGLTGAEIADVLGRSPGAIKIAQLRAYTRIRTLLDVETDHISVTRAE